MLSAEPTAPGIEIPALGPTYVPLPHLSRLESREATLVHLFVSGLACAPVNSPTWLVAVFTCPTKVTERVNEFAERNFRKVSSDELARPPGNFCGTHKRSRTQAIQRYPTRLDEWASSPVSPINTENASEIFASVSCAQAEVKTKIGRRIDATAAHQPRKRPRKFRGRFLRPGRGERESLRHLSCAPPVLRQAGGARWSSRRVEASEYQRGSVQVF